MNNNYLIINIQPKKSICIQVNKRDTDGICYNVTFNKQTDYLVCDGFMVPTFYGNSNISFYGNSDTQSMIHCLKVLPKIHENKTDLLSFLAAMIKKEKITQYQINVNANMDYSASKKIDLATIATIAIDLQKLDIPVKF